MPFRGGHTGAGATIAADAADVCNGEDGASTIRTATVSARGAPGSTVQTHRGAAIKIVQSQRAVRAARE
jgi:hypothetical protein